LPYLDGKSRAQLPDSAFAYIDSGGRRRLPIHDQAHVRNALARFNQTRFESEAARDRARTRLLKAAKKYGIVPVGFITGQLTNVRERAEILARESEVHLLPRGLVTFLFSDIEDSTGLLRQLGNRYARLLTESRKRLKDAVRSSGGQVVDMRADEMFAVFKRAPDALAAAIVIQRQAPPPVRIRVGLHTGRPTLTETGYVGIAVHMAARVCSAAHGGQIVVSRFTREAVADPPPSGVGFRDLGQHRLRGLSEAEQLFQVEPETG
jgi:class 3 adenylate cyclase